jgi:hypothetical protein
LPSFPGEIGIALPGKPALSIYLVVSVDSCNLINYTARGCL